MRTRQAWITSSLRKSQRPKSAIGSLAALGGFDLLRCRRVLEPVQQVLEMLGTEGAGLQNQFDGDQYGFQSELGYNRQDLCHVMRSLLHT